MCINNFVRRPRPVTDANSNTKKHGSPGGSNATISSRPSLITERLMGGHCGGNAPFSAETLASLPQLLLKTSSPTPPLFSNQSSSNGNGTAGQPKRKRKPQKPGLTAKNNARQFVQHNYHDHALDLDVSDHDDASSNHQHEVDEEEVSDHHQHMLGGEERTTTTKRARRGGVSISFPMKLHAVLERIDQAGFGHVVSWQSHGRAFKIHRPSEFVEQIMPEYFRQSKLTSFQRQLNLYGFSRLTRGLDAGSYYHELFLRGRGGLAKTMQRTKVKGTRYKAASNPEAEPDFYKMPPVSHLPAQVSDESSTDDSFGDVTTEDVHSVTTNNERKNSAGAFFHPADDFEPIAFRVNNNVQSLSPLPFLQGIRREQPNAVGQWPILMGLSQTLTATTAGRPTAAGGPSFSFPLTNGGGYTGLTAVTPSGVFVQQQPAAPSQVTATDQVFDAAVDELFSSSDPVEDILSLDDLWNPTSGSVQNDEQLGYLLDSFLQEK